MNRCIMKAYLITFAWISVLLLSETGVTLASQTDVLTTLREVGLSSATAVRISTALELGLSLDHLGQYAPEEIAQWFKVKEGPLDDKEAILLTITQALEDGLPAAMLIDKVKQGLGQIYDDKKNIIPQPRHPLPQIRHEISVRAQLLAGVEGLLHGKNIFVSEEARAGLTVLPLRRFDALVTNIADALGDYLEGDGNPYDGFLLYQAMSTRLRNQSSAESVIPAGESIIPAEDVDLVLDRIEPGDLTPTVLKALNQS